MINNTPIIIASIGFIKYTSYKANNKLPIPNTKTPKIQAIPVWKALAQNIFLLEPNSLRIAPIAPKQGALNKLNTINAYALAGLKKLKISDWKINENTSFSSARPAITFIFDTTNSFATSPWNAETVAPHDHSPSIGQNNQANILPTEAKIESLTLIPYFKFPVK